MAMKNKKQQGFSFIELLIAVAILGIIAAIAVPNYGAYMQETRRLDAKAFLQEVAGEQVRFFSDNNVYATSMSELGYGANATFRSPEGHYDISIENEVTTSFTLTATPVTNGAQDGDTRCDKFTLDSTGLKNVSGSVGLPWLCPIAIVTAAVMLAVPISALITC